MMQFSKLIIITLILFVSFSSAIARELNGSGKSNTAVIESKIRNMDNNSEILKSNVNLSKKNDLDNDIHEIMSTRNNCTASCCSNNGSVKKKVFSKNSSRKTKKGFGWFSRKK